MEAMRWSWMVLVLVVLMGGCSALVDEASAIDETVTDSETRFDDETLSEETTGSETVSDSETMTTDPVATESESATETETVPDDPPDDLVEWIPFDGGTFVQGSTEFAAEAPTRTVAVLAFDLMRTEVTKAMYLECVDAGACPLDPEFEDGACWWTYNFRNNAATCLSRGDMASFCAWVGGRLPTESEWEWAATNEGNTIYPWGFGAMTREHAWFGSVEGSAPVCAATLGLSHKGICDLIGNAREVVQDDWHPTYDGAPTDGSAWRNGLDGYACRGGGISDIDEPTLASGQAVDALGVRVDSRYRARCPGDLDKMEMDQVRDDTGFRCAR